jgi:hypothetical protein
MHSAKAWLSLRGEGRTSAQWPVIRPTLDAASRPESEVIRCSESLRNDGTEIDPRRHTSSVLFSPLRYGGQIENPSWTEERAEGYEPDWPSVYAQPNGEYSATQEATGP